MAKIMFGIIAALASFMLAEALICNKCNYGLGSFCVSNTNETCSNATSFQCGTTKIAFTSLTKVGFYSQGCLLSTACNKTSDGTLVLAYQNKVECCTSDRCNKLINGAPSTKMTLTAAVGVAVLASMWGSIL